MWHLSDDAVPAHGFTGHWCCFSYIYEHLPGPFFGHLEDLGIANPYAPGCAGDLPLRPRDAAWRAGRPSCVERVAGMRRLIVTMLDRNGPGWYDWCSGSLPDNHGLPHASRSGRARHRTRRRARGRRFRRLKP